jgi:energy-converting hydrogenase Eha subunit A
MEITGSVVVSAIMAVIAGFVTQAVKQAVPESWHRYIPLPLALVLTGVGVLLAWLQGQNMVTGGLEGFLGAALAVYGYQAIRGFVKPQGDDA